MSYFYNYNKFKGQEAELLIRDGMRASAQADAYASRDALRLTLRQHLDLRRKSAAVMETVCVTGKPGTGVHNLAVILSGQSKAARLDQSTEECRWA